MNTYVVGDIQGCADELQRLLEAVRFSPGRDRLWCVGDLINRGPKSLEVLRLVRELGSAACTVLGNHDLSVLVKVLGTGKTPDQGAAAELAAAPDRDVLAHWLRHRPLAHFEQGWLMIHAGLPPQWTRDTALACAREVETALQGDDYLALLAAMFGDQPDCWSESLAGMDRLRFSINCLTRLRQCHPDGRLALNQKGAPAPDDRGLRPWFAMPGRASATQPIVFGHWSTLGQVYWPQHRVWGLDTGCVWGGELTALHLESRRLIRVPGRMYQQPGA